MSRDVIVGVLNHQRLEEGCLTAGRGVEKAVEGAALTRGRRVGWSRVANVVVG